MALLKQRTSSAYARGLMNIEANPMSRAVKVALHPSVHESCLVASFLKPLADALMDLVSVGTIFNLSDGFFLRILHGVIQLFQLWARPPSYHAPRHVGEIPAGRRSRKHVEDDTAMCRQGAAAYIVRIAGLFPTRDDRMLGDALALHQFHINEFLHSFRRQRCAVEPQLVALDRRSSQGVMRGYDGRFRGSLGGFNMANFLGRLDDAPLVKRFPLRLNPVAQCLKAAGMAEGKITWHQQLRDPDITQHDMDDVHTRWFGDTLGFDSSFNFRVRQHAIDGGLAFGPVHFEITHDQNPFTLDLEINERVR